MFPDSLFLSISISMVTESVRLSVRRLSVLPYIYSSLGAFLKFLVLILRGLDCDDFCITDCASGPEFIVLLDSTVLTIVCRYWHLWWELVSLVWSFQWGRELDCDGISSIFVLLHACHTCTGARRFFLCAEILAICPSGWDLVLTVHMNMVAKSGYCSVFSELGIFTCLLCPPSWIDKRFECYSIFLE